jgi:hypothetical protein
LKSARIGSSSRSRKIAAVPADLVDEQERGVEPGLDRGVAQVVDRAAVLVVVAHASEVDSRGRELEMGPGLDQLLMDRVELVGLGIERLQPLPLDDARLEQRRRGVGIVFEHSRRLARAIEQVEAAIEILVAALPAGVDQLGALGADAEAVIVALGDHLFDRGEADPLQLGGGVLQRVDLGGGEAVGRGLVPIGLAVDGVEGEAKLLRAGREVGARRDRDALHAACRLGSGGAGRAGRGAAEAAARAAGRGGAPGAALGGA